MGVHEGKGILVHLTLTQNLHAQTIQNGYYFSNRELYNDASLSGDLSTLISHFLLFILPQIKHFQSQEVVYRSIVASTLIPTQGPIVEHVIETSGGDQNSESLPSYCAAVLTLRTGRGGKSNRGRSYYSGVCEDHSKDSRLNPDFLTALQNIGNQLVSIFGNAAGINPFVYVMYSRKVGDTESGNPTSAGIKVINQTIARSVLGTQRHRKIGIGN